MERLERIQMVGQDWFQGKMTCAVTQALTHTRACSFCIGPHKLECPPAIGQNLNSSFQLDQFLLLTSGSQPISFLYVSRSPKAIVLYSFGYSLNISCFFIPFY